MENKQYRIALVIKTDGLEYDDRVRKEILTVQKLFPNISFKIYAMLPNNDEIEGVTGYGIPYKTVFIPAREKYPSAQKPYLKAYQFYKVLKNELKDYDVVWAANEDTSFFPLLLKHDRILWDLHELPDSYFTSKWKKLLLKFLFKRCKEVLHANPQRVNYLQQLGVIKDVNKHFAVRNYPNFEDVDENYDDKYYNFIKWKGNRNCVYLQGLNADRRAPYESISAVMAIPDLCAVVVGGFDSNAMKKLEEKYSDELGKRILFIGKIPQLKIPQYVRQCYVSLVFYKNVSPNNYYCEANRFYQSVIMGLPVVVGNNPSMRELVEKYKFGVSIDDDGSNIEKIVEGIKTVIYNYLSYKDNILNNKSHLLWENQESLFKEIVSILFK